MDLWGEMICARNCVCLSALMHIKVYTRIWYSEGKHTIVLGWEGCDSNAPTTEAKQIQARDESTPLSHMLADRHQHVRRHEVGVLSDLDWILGFDGAQLVHVDEVHAGDFLGQLTLPACKNRARA